MAARMLFSTGARNAKSLCRQIVPVRAVSSLATTGSNVKVVKAPPLTDEEKFCLERRFEHDYHGDEEAEIQKWRKISLFGVMPFLTCLFLYIVIIDHEPHVRPKFKPYEHIRIYRKPLPWRDGKGPMLFNEKMVATKDGYLVDPPSH